MHQGVVIKEHDALRGMGSSLRLGYEQGRER